MEQEDRERLKRVLELAENNGKILKKMRSTMRWGRVLESIYWIVIVGIAAGSFYFLQPFLLSIQGTYKTLQEGVENVRESFQGMQDEVDEVRNSISR